MQIDDASTRAQHLLESARERRPRWRNSERFRPAPAWFRGGELNLVDEPERRELYVNNDVRRRTQPMLGIALMLPVLPPLIRDVRTGVDQTFWLVGAIIATTAFIGALLLRRRNIVASACRTLRETPGWPLRLDAARTPPPAPGLEP